MPLNTDDVLKGTVLLQKLSTVELALAHVTSMPPHADAVRAGAVLRLVKTPPGLASHGTGKRQTPPGPEIPQTLPSLATDATGTGQTPTNSCDGSAAASHFCVTLQLDPAAHSMEMPLCV